MYAYSKYKPTPKRNQLEAMKFVLLHSVMSINCNNLNDYQVEMKCFHYVDLEPANLINSHQPQPYLDTVLI